MLIALIVGVTTNNANSTPIPDTQSPLGNRGIEWGEQDGYAIVNGNNYHYWLYSTDYFCDYHNWDRKFIGSSVDDRLNILRTALLQWVERDGWTIDYEKAWLTRCKMRRILLFSAEVVQKLKFLNNANT
jgi:hypothetical protein